MRFLAPETMLSGFILAAGFAAAAVPAEAGKLRFDFHGFDEPHVMAIDTHTCTFYYDRWQSTGRVHWKRKYFDCIGWS